MKIRNKSKARLATANEIAKALIINRIEGAFYFDDNDEYNKVYNEAFKAEIQRHMLKHFKAIRERLDVDGVDVSDIDWTKEHMERYESKK